MQGWIIRTGGVGEKQLKIYDCRRFFCNRYLNQFRMFVIIFLGFFVTIGLDFRNILQR